MKALVGFQQLEGPSRGLLRALFNHREPSLLVPGGVARGGKLVVNIALSRHRPLLLAGPGYAEIILIVTFSQQQTLASSFAGTSGVTGDRLVTCNSPQLAAVSSPPQHRSRAWHLRDTGVFMQESFRWIVQ